MMNLIQSPRLPSPEDLFSGRPVEWSPFDTDARYLRWSSHGWHPVPKGQDAKPKGMKHKPILPLVEAIQIKLWKTIDACPDLIVRMGKPDFPLSAPEQVSFLGTRNRKEPGLPPFYTDHFNIRTLGYCLSLQFLESKTGRTDLVVSFTCEKHPLLKEREENSACSIDISDVHLTLTSSKGVAVARPIIGINALLVFQDIEVGYRYHLSMDKPENTNDGQCDMIFVEPEGY